jgi:hypothetical protein
MNLTQERVQEYVGGQIEIQNPGEGYMYRGDIKIIDIKDGELTVTTSWLAKGIGSLPIPRGWVKAENKPYVISLEIYSVSEIGDNRLCLNSPFVGETTVLFPKGGSRLEPSKVAGLEGFVDN